MTPEEPNEESEGVDRLDSSMDGAADEELGFWRRNFTQNRPPDRWLSRLAIVVAVVSLVAGWIGAALAPQFVSEFKEGSETIIKNPLLLIGLNPRNTNLVLVTGQVEALPYYVVGFGRLLFSDPFNYLLGFWFGDKALAWVERRSRTYGPLVRDGERMFAKFSKVLIFVMPNNIISMLSGATGMKVRTFFALNAAGTLTRLFLIRQFGERFASPIGGVLDFVGKYRTPLLILSILAVAWTVFGEFRGDNSELAALRELDKEAKNEGDA